LSSARRLAGFSPVHLLVLVAVAELSINRLAVPTLRPTPAQPIVPLWFQLLDNLGLLLLYFASTLAVGVVALRAWDSWTSRAQVPGLAAIGRLATGVALAIFAALAAAMLIGDPDLGFALHTAWAAAILAIVVTALARRQDLGVALGLAAIAAPLLLRYVTIFAGNVVLDEEQLGEGMFVERARGWGLHALVLAALVTPYCLAPRPVVRAVTRLAPLVVAMLIGGLGAVLVRREYRMALELAELGVGVNLAPGVPAGDMALYLLAIATLAWTLTSCALAESEARREVGMGLGMVVLGGYAFDWPLHFLLGAVGMLVILDAAPRLRDEEAPRALRPRTPPIDDEAWQRWIGQLAGRLRDGDAEVRTVTVRDDDGATTVMVGERHAVPFKLRLGRVAGALVSIDVVCAREVPEAQRATFTLHARPEGTREVHPPPPPAAPALRIDDESFAARFRVRGDAAAVARLLDEPLRARAAALLDGWLAWWEGAGLRFRVFPAIGAPLDHPVPISDLAMRGAGTVERLEGVIDLLCAIAARGSRSASDGEPEPTVLD
jgi:hypothetical protein